MVRRNSIFVKILIPIIIIIILQPVLIGTVLFAYGVFDSLDESAVDSISNNAENQSLVLTDKMVSAWANLDRLEFDVINILDDFIANERLLLTNIIGNRPMEIQLLGLLSDSLLNALRQTTATGAFVYFVNDTRDEAVVLNGLYYRNMDPLTYLPDNSDLLLLRGPEEIAGAKRIPLDHFWQERFSFSPDYPDNWDAFNKPLSAARQNRFMPSTDLAYWSRAISMNPGFPGDTNRCITYTRPVIYEGTVVAMIGTEVQLSNLERYLSAGDFSFDQSGYMLLRYSGEDYQPGSQTINSEIVFVTGSHIRQLTHSMENIRFGMTGRQNIYSIDKDDVEPVQVAIKPLNIYHANSSFHHDQWAVAALSTDNALFWMSRMLTMGIIISSAIALVIGTALLWFIIRRNTKPLISIADQIQNNTPSEHILVDNANIYEVSLLSSTINTMKDERTKAEDELRTERERYLVALESVADTVVEYDVSDDSFVLYYFELRNDKSELCSNVLNGLTELITSGNFCHEDDINTMLSFLRDESARDTEVRIKTDVFSHITNTIQDDGYYWFFIKSSLILNNNGETIKIIGTAREFTKKKLSDYANIESSRRDSTTKLYNHDYGFNLTKGAAADAFWNKTPFSLSIISINNYDEIEAGYGRVFAASILMNLFTGYPATGKNIKTRLSNDEILLLIQGADRQDVAAYTDKFFAYISKLYTGENPDLRLKVSIGTVFSDSADNFGTLMQYAYQTADYAERNNEGGTEFYTDLPAEATDETATGRNRPVNISLEVAKGNMSNYTFELFESTTDTHSAVNMLITVLGRVYLLRQIVICTYDADFGTGRVTHKWNNEGINTQSYGTEKISHNDWIKFEAKLDENGTYLFTDTDVEQSSDTVKRLLCMSPKELTGGYCCVIYENGIPSGRILFHTHENAREWPEEELRELYEITKIIAVNLSNEKSTSASRAKSEFLSRISHEIRTPMNSIIGMTNIARKSVTETVRLTDSLDKIDFSAKYLLALINNVLEMSRIESGKIIIENKYFSLEKFAQDINMLMRPAIENNEISFDINIDVSHQFQLLGDEIKLRQVIINLLGNANKFTQKNGSITLTINELGLDEGFIYLIFSVKDNGPGIAAEEQAGIFKTFEQGRSISSVQRQQGSGLGLTISAGIVSAMGGTLLLESKLGKGSEFYFTLKLKLIQDKSLDTNDKDSDIFYKTFFSGKNVLVVDDIDMNLEIAEFILEEVGFNVDTATDGQEAVDKFLASEVNHYDIIVMDIEMPVMDGLTATRIIRRNQERHDAQTVPIVAMTANAFDEELNESIESGMNGNIIKPIDIDIFYQVLHTILSDKGESR